MDKAPKAVVVYVVATAIHAALEVLLSLLQGYEFFTGVRATWSVLQYGYGSPLTLLSAGGGAMWHVLVILGLLLAAAAKVVVCVRLWMGKLGVLLWVSLVLTVADALSCYGALGLPAAIGAGVLLAQHPEVRAWLDAREAARGA